MRAKSKVLFLAACAMAALSTAASAQYQYPKVQFYQVPQYNYVQPYAGATQVYPRQQYNYYPRATQYYQVPQYQYIQPYAGATQVYPQYQYQPPRQYYYVQPQPRYYNYR